MQVFQAIVLLLQAATAHQLARILQKGTPVRIAQAGSRKASNHLRVLQPAPASEFCNLTRLSAADLISKANVKPFDEVLNYYVGEAYKQIKSIKTKFVLVVPRGEIFIFAVAVGDDPLYPGFLPNYLYAAGKELTSFTLQSQVMESFAEDVESLREDISKNLAKYYDCVDQENV